MAISNVTIDDNVTYPVSGKWRISPSGPSGGMASIQIYAGNWDGATVTLTWSAIGTTFTNVPISASDQTAVTLTADGIFNALPRAGYIELSVSGGGASLSLTVDALGLVAE